MIYVYSIIIYGNKQKWVKLLSVTLIFAICWLLNIYGGYLGVHPRWKPIVDARTNVLLCPFTIYCSTYQILSLGSTHSFLRLTNVLLKHRYVCFHCSILLYTFVVFQVECMWRLLSTTCTVKPCKPLVSLLFLSQWNHRDCTASIPMHCPFNRRHSFEI